MRNYTGVSDAFDLSDGKIPEVADMLEVIYRDEVTRLMAEAGAVRGPDAAPVLYQKAALQPDATAAEGGETLAAQDAAPAADTATSARSAPPEEGGFARMLGWMLAKKNRETAQADPAPQTPEVRVNKGLGQSSTGCVRRGTTLTCD